MRLHSMRERNTKKWALDEVFIVLQDLYLPYPYKLCIVTQQWVFFAILFMTPKHLKSANPSLKKHSRKLPDDMNYVL